MIIEMRTYTLKPGNIPTFEERFGGALAIREKFSKLAAFWHTEVGAIDELIQVRVYARRERGCSFRKHAFDHDPRGGCVLPGFDENNGVL